MPCSSQSALVSALAVYLALGSPTLSALDPHKTFTQYTRAVWTQSNGLPQDAVRRIAQTADGYLWLGTEEGLARFDGYDFATFTRANSSLPSNSITVLTPGRDGILWIGTTAGLVRYRNGRFTTFTTRDGLQDNAITALLEDHNGVLWIAAGMYLTRLKDDKFTNLSAPIKVVTVFYEDPQHALWIAGVDGLVRVDHGNFVKVLGPRDLDGTIATSMTSDRTNHLWISGTKGLISRGPDGKLRKFNTRDGLPDNMVHILLIDRNGNVWVGTNRGLGRLEGDRIVFSGNGLANGADGVRCLFEDSEGDLWIGMDSGLVRLRDDPFTVYGRTEGLPSDEPTALHQDRAGNLWVGYHGDGLLVIHQGRFRVYTTRDGLPSNEIFAIRESQTGDILLSTRRGLSRLHGGSFSNYVLPDPFGRQAVHDALEDRRGHIWLAAPGGLYEMIGKEVRNVIQGGPLASEICVVLSEGVDGSIWVATYGNGLWQIKDGKTRQFSTADGLGSNRIRSLYQDRDGTLWIGALGDGLNALRNGIFYRYSAKDGLLSDNVYHIDDDANGALWLSTTRGICRITKQQLLDYSAGRIMTLTPVSYGVQDGLRSAQSAPGYPTGGGGTKTNDGRLWFTTSRGLAVIDPEARGQNRPSSAPIVRVVELTVDGQNIDLSRAAKLKPGTDIRLRYAGIYLSAPERIRYAYRLEGLDDDWISAGTRRTVDYLKLGHGHYRFVARASLPGQPSREASFNFEVLPHLYERGYFLWLCAGSCLAVIYGFYRLRIQQIRGRFFLVLDERERLAREIHDTLAQGLVGISRQLDAISMRVKSHDKIAQQHLVLAQKMARHSLTETKRSLMDLRASACEDGDLLSALTMGAREWTAAGAVPFEIDTVGTFPRMHEDVDHNLLRICQEAVTNALNHAGATKIWIHLRMESDGLLLAVKDNGRGFEYSNALAASGGHFGLLGMRERAERLGGEVHILSELGVGTQVKVSIPLSSENLRDGTGLRRQRDLAGTPHRMGHS